LSAWRELRVFTTAGEGLTVNCYLVWDEVTRDAALFDKLTRALAHAKAALRIAEDRWLELEELRAELEEV